LLTDKLHKLSYAKQTRSASDMVKMRVDKPERLAVTLLDKQKRGSYSRTGTLILAVTASGNVRRCGKPEIIKLQKLKAILAVSYSRRLATVVALTSAAYYVIALTQIGKILSHLVVSRLKAYNVGLFGVYKLSDTVLAKSEFIRALINVYSYVKGHCLYHSHFYSPP
jgi:hypothetical protein